MTIQTLHMCAQQLTGLWVNVIDFQPIRIVGVLPVLFRLGEESRPSSRSANRSERRCCAVLGSAAPRLLAAAASIPSMAGRRRLLRLRRSHNPSHRRPGSR